jgi:aspartate/methionine/tyrosine aminotransferase
MTTFEPFLMERWMSKYEQEVDYNLSESGVHPMKVRELIDDNPDYLQQLLESDLNYPHVNGIPSLRENISRMYENATIDNVLVTVGAAEANYITVHTLLSPGDEMAVMLPNYMQIWGIGRNHHLKVRGFHLRDKGNWVLDVAELEEIVTPKTKVIAVCNPNNPTGYALTKSEMDAIIQIASRTGAWIVADEVYSGAERLGNEQTPSFYGLYDRVIANGSMSKAYGLPGLRIGWSVGPADVIDQLWARHEYTTISATMLANGLAAIALSPEVRPRLLARTRDYIRKGYPVLESWMDDHRDTLSLIPPDAAAIAFIRYNLDVNSTELAERLYREKRVLVVPGDHFGMDHYLRISFGLPHDYLIAGLARIREVIEELT